MAMSTIYKPTGKALEYGEYALNIFDGCPHRCVYCYARMIARKSADDFAECKPRKNIVEETRKWFARRPEIKGKHIHLCFTCDSFPAGRPDFAEVTMNIIYLIHESGNYVQILTKGNIPDEAIRMLKPEDIVGVTMSSGNELARKVEPNAICPSDRLLQLECIKKRVGCRTFVSCEPVFDANAIYRLIVDCDFIDEFKIGKLNYMAKDNPFYPSIDWKIFGNNCERLCIANDRKYYIKESLREEMEK
jgi:DNA repair photolyase